nr:MAG TPA: hypothetical protein [Caudoviricetes sp.]
MPSFANDYPFLAISTATLSPLPSMNAVMLATYKSVSKVYHQRHALGEVIYGFK